MNMRKNPTIARTAHQEQIRARGGCDPYCAAFPIDGMTFSETGATPYTASLVGKPKSVDGIVYFALQFTSEGTRPKRLTAVFQASDLLIGGYSEWAMFFIRHWLFSAKRPRHRHLFFWIPETGREVDNPNSLLSGEIAPQCQTASGWTR